MKKVLVISTQVEAPQTSDRLAIIDLVADTIRSDEIDVQTTLFEDLFFSIKAGSPSVYDTRNDVILDTFDLVYIKNWGQIPEPARALDRWLRSEGIQVITQETENLPPQYKLSEGFALAIEGVPYPETAFTHDPARLSEAIKHAGFEYPLVVKSIEGRVGKDNYLVESEDQLRSLLPKMRGQSFMAQGFVPNDGDHRVLIMGYKPVLSFHRSTDEDTHLNNTSQGGGAALTDLSDYSDAVLEDCVKAARATKRDIAGVDVMFNSETGQHYILEANTSPQIVSGAYLEEKSQAFKSYIHNLLESEG